MKLFFCSHPGGFANCYVLGTEGEKNREAIVIDPGAMNLTLLNIIEEHSYKLRAVLITHDHSRHSSGLRCLKRIYNADIYAVNQYIAEHKAFMVRDGDTVDVGPFRCEVISVPGHSPDSVVYKIQHMLFTGDVLTAGRVGRTTSIYGATTQMIAIRSKLFTMPGEYIILPGHGPPSSLSAEQLYNIDIQKYNQKKHRQQRFTVDW
ncbi:hypothetical protein FACS1894164_10160 [Spirochaetia bacterium]|nr:hypothetical protein FACS1894164_10160 [Spirochaetia bacterium]